MARKTKFKDDGRAKFEAELEAKASPLRGNVGNVEAVKTSSEPTTKPQSFSQAFRAARNELGAGKTFTWQGKSYSTNMAGEGASKPKATSAPVKRDTPAAKADGMGTLRRGTSAMAGALGRVNPVRKPMTGDGDSAAKLAADIKRGSPFDKKATPAPSDPHADRVKAMIAAGKDPKASGYARSRAKFYENNPDAMKKGGKVKKYAKGGSVDGCAIRGKTRASMRRK